MTVEQLNAYMYSLLSVDFMPTCLGTMYVQNGVIDIKLLMG